MRASRVSSGNMSLGHVTFQRTLAASCAAASLISCRDYTCFDTASCAVSDAGYLSQSSGSDGAESTAEAQSAQSMPPASSVASTSEPPGATTDGANSTNTDGTDGANTDAPATTDRTDSASQGATLANIGDLCGGGDECAEGTCVDGVCCATRCTDVCAECNVVGMEGSCVLSEDDPSCTPPECPDSSECMTVGAVAAPTCADIGECRTEANCTYEPIPLGTPCQAGAGACDGAGECIVPDKLGLGEPCSAPDDCGSSYCSLTTNGNRVCCDAACEGVCEACNSAGSCNSAPGDDDRCEAITCPANTECTEYPEPRLTDRCVGFRQCITSGAHCQANHAQAGETCGAGPSECSGQDTCNSVGVCQSNDLTNGSSCFHGECEQGSCEAVPNPFDCIAPDPPELVLPDDRFVMDGAPPAATGGVILDGIYTPVRIDLYNGANQVRVMTFEFSHSYVQMNLQDRTMTNGAGFIDPIQFAGSLSTSGTSIVWDVERCDPQYNIDPPAQVPYTATVNGLRTVQATSDGGTAVVSYARN